MVLGQGTALTVVGIAVGLLLAAGLTRYLQGLLFGLTPLDPGAFAAAAVLFGAAAAVAAYVPARRATRIDPVAALRSE
jgi:ABC-type antimicrobial peptide transport system permease subunit